MTYKDNFVVEVKCNGKILRVRDGAVYLPFGSEYSIFLKNLNSRKASVKIHIDGQDVLDYSSLILEPNSSTELQGELGGTAVRNRFKFIKKTEKIQEHRGDRVDDGMIRVEFSFEKRKKEILREDHEHHHHHHHHNHSYYHWWPQWTYTSHNAGTKDNLVGSSGGDFTDSRNAADNLRSLTNSVQAYNCSVGNITQDSLGIESLGKPLDDEGITVKGSECYQSFRYGSIGELEQSQVITIQLKGMANSGNITVEKPVTVKDKLTCSTCGTKSKSSSKFCSECGTFLN
ncbi:MAG: hypothetical protein ACFFG0_02110 [Candidatus Thorarchaeota archaeon]